MNDNHSQLPASIAVVRGEVVSVLTLEDRAFLQLIANAGMTLEGVFNRITAQDKRTYDGAEKK